MCKGCSHTDRFSDERKCSRESMQALKVPTPRHTDSSRLAVIMIAPHPATKFNFTTHSLLCSAVAQPKRTTMDTHATWAIADRWADSQLPRFFPQLFNTVEILAKSWQQVGTTRFLSKWKCLLLNCMKAPITSTRNIENLTYFSLPIFLLILFTSLLLLQKNI